LAALVLAFACVAVTFLTSPRDSGAAQSPPASVSTPRNDLKSTLADDHQAAKARLTAVRDRLPADSVERREAVQILGLCYYLTNRFAVTG